MVCHHAGFCIAACLEHWGDCNHDYRDGCEAPTKHRFYCDGDGRIEKERRPEPIAGVFVTGEGVGPGQLDMAEFSVGLGAYRAGLRKCYERALTAKPGLHGAWFYEFTIAVDGHVTAAKLISAAARSTELEACVAQYAASVRLANGPKGGAVTFPCRVVFVAPRSERGQEEQQDASVDSSAGSETTWLAGLSALPQDVLVGTDVVALASLTATPHAFTAGTYRSEQGGALATVKLERGSTGMAITRHFQEAGERRHTKAYKALSLSADGYRLSGSEIEVISVNDGVVVLERASEVESVPKSLWILYEPARGSAGK